MHSSRQNESSTEEYPIVFVKDKRLYSAPIGEHLLKTLPNSAVREENSLLEGFQYINSRAPGILILSIDSKKEFTVFYKALAILLKSLAAGKMRIVIFSGNDEIVDSRTLAQFQFLSAYPPQKTVARYVALITREWHRLHTELDASTKRTERAAFAPVQRMMVIRGETIVDEDPTANEKSFFECVNKDVTTFIYDMGLNWRLRGHFSSIDTDRSIVTFTPADSANASAAMTRFNGQRNLLSSSASPSARICAALELVDQGPTQMQFTLPKFLEVVQRRSSTRVPVPKNHQVLLRLDSNGGGEIYSVMDFSAEGLGFYIDIAAKPNFTPDIVLRDMRLYLSGHEIAISKAEIRHVSPADRKAQICVVGLKILEIPPRDKALLEMAIFSELVQG